MKRIFTLFTLLFLSVVYTSAKQVEQSTALRLATNFVSGYSALRSTPQLKLVYAADAKSSGHLKAGSQPLYYIYNVSDNNGFVIISGEDNITPILGYSDNGAFMTENIPDNLKSWLELYENEISWMIEEGHEASDEIKQKWEELSNGKGSLAAQSVLLPTANWDQSGPYNNLCPMDGNKRSVSGCVATAMAIIMKYHQWPLQGSGSNSYTTETKKLRVSADFDTTYDWSNMLDTYDEGNRSWTKAQGDAVATLVYHSGAAVHMDYTNEESGAYTHEALNAFIQNFGYDKGAYLTTKDIYSDGQWHYLLQKELDEKRPILYGGLTAKDAGHQFVLDGYNQSFYYHVNWGWSGYSNGYYLLSSLEPNWQGIGGNKEGAGYSFNQDAIIGLQKPQEGSTENYEIIYTERRGIDVCGLFTDVDIIKRNTPFTLHFSAIYEYSLRDFEGYFGALLIGEDGSGKELLSYFKSALPGGQAVHLSEGLSITIKSEAVKGDVILFCYSQDGRSWTPIRGPQGSVNQLPVNVSLTANDTPELALAPDVFLSPTIVESEFQIRTENGARLQRVMIYSISGQLAKDLKFNQTDDYTTVQVMDLKPGIYIVSVQTSTGNRQFKIVKK
ncbi:thiol protease/hemagglutinin PrtT [Parabacteroides sp. PF5-9]|uniref:thiol protease/hemagglutinin PrtT n=1 Tax=Parabacteroides sp. PF5-9 TaxID=1742404 RepID=UPI002474B6E6|nr:thiol protease/hemagglutinin PrtT [Parabacteroides sp. PF5-9]MDH6356850.1 hypothetical protein [Parabacteroides sp. PF5-9]